MTTKTSVDELSGIARRAPGDEEQFGVAGRRPKWIHRTTQVTTYRWGRYLSASWACGSASTRPRLFATELDAAQGRRQVAPCPSCAIRD